MNRIQKTVVPGGASLKKKKKVEEGTPSSINFSFPCSQFDQTAPSNCPV
jgi:hypothetical protein